MLTVIDRYAYHERYAIMYEAARTEGPVDNQALTRIAQQANASAAALPFSVAATAMANRDLEPAKELCRREQEKHGREWALELWAEMERAVAEARELP